MIIKKIKLLKVFILTPLIISLSYSMNNENNLHNSNQINNNINLQNDNINNQNSNNNQNEFLNRKRKGQHEQDEINDENNIENTINNVSNTFTHTVSFHPSVLTSDAEIYNSELEFNLNYGNKSMPLNNICKMRCYSNFSYQDFIEVNNKLQDIVQDKLRYISLSSADNDRFTNLNEKQYPILELANFRQNDIEKLQINNNNIINMVYQIKLLKRNIKIACDHLNYIALINEIGIKEYAVQEDQNEKAIYDKMLSIINNVEEHIKSDNFTENDFVELKKIHLINCDYSEKISDYFKVFDDLYNKLRVSSNKLEQINIVEQFYSMIVDEKKLFSIFYEILLRDKNTISIIDKLLRECWRIQDQYKNITYGGIDLIHQTILNTIDQHFISNYPSEEIDYKYSKNSNKAQFKIDYHVFVMRRIFHSQDLSNSQEATNYLERVFIKPVNNAINDIKRYKTVFEHSDYHNGYLLFDNLYKFLDKNLNNINYDLFKKDWVNEEKIITDYVKNGEDSLFEKVWLSAPKLEQLEAILERIKYCNDYIQINNNNNNDELLKHKNKRERVIDNFWDNIILDEDIFNQILQQNDNRLLKLIKKILDIKEVKDYHFAYDKKIFDIFFNTVMEKFKKREIDKKHIKDTYLNYLNQYTNFLEHLIMKLEKIYSEYNNINILEANNNSLVYKSSKTLELIKTILNHLELRLQSFKDNKEKQKNIVDEFIEAQVSSFQKKPSSNKTKPLFKVKKK